MDLTTLSADALNSMANIFGISVKTLLIILFFVLVWKLFWYSLALYKSLERKHRNWFVVLFISTFILNDLGVLAMVYLYFYRDKKHKLKTTRKKKR